jgi:hypothetical protein
MLNIDLLSLPDVRVRQRFEFGLRIRRAVFGTLAFVLIVSSPFAHADSASSWNSHGTSWPPAFSWNAQRASFGLAFAFPSNPQGRIELASILVSLCLLTALAFWQRRRVAGWTAARKRSTTRPIRGNRLQRLKAHLFPRRHRGRKIRMPMMCLR